MEKTNTPDISAFVRLGHQYLSSGLILLSSKSPVGDQSFLQKQTQEILPVSRTILRKTKTVTLLGEETEKKST